jgi:hypothetical protein
MPLSHVVNVLLRVLFCTCQLVFLLQELIVLLNQFFCTIGIVGSGLIYWERPDIGIQKEKKWLKRMSHGINICF